MGVRGTQAAVATSSIPFNRPEFALSVRSLSSTSFAHGLRVLMFADCRCRYGRMEVRARLPKGDAAFDCVFVVEFLFFLQEIGFGPPFGCFPD